jgi:hypothetical protein
MSGEVQKAMRQLRSSLKRLSSRATAPAELPPASAAVNPDSNDAIALSLEAQINRITELADEVDRTRVRPSEDAMEALLEEGWGGESRYPTDEAWTAACADLEARTGRGKAIEEIQSLVREQDALIDRLWKTPVASNIGRAAKVRILLRHMTMPDWRQGLEDGDADQIRTVQLLAELCGESPASLTKAALRGATGP